MEKGMFNIQCSILNIQGRKRLALEAVKYFMEETNVQCSTLNTQYSSIIAATNQEAAKSFKSVRFHWALNIERWTLSIFFRKDYILFNSLKFGNSPTALISSLHQSNL